ncbi:Protein T19B10.2 [Aphelenchoides avenae]|nr:Protein T19B10.2 [Aphelenchus avenae]
MATAAFLVLVASLIATASAQSCDARQSLGNYLNCLKGALDSNYGEFEQELKAHSRRAAETCFSQTISEANTKGRCVLALTDLEAKAWDRNGPLRDCSICRTFAAGAIKAVLSTPPEDQKCIRTQISKAIAKEADFCLRRKIPNFPGVPEIPDLEEGSFAIRDDVINSISDYILIHSRLSFCSERKPERAAATRQCLRTPFPGYLKKHCNSLAQCDQQAAGAACLQPLNQAKAATCECIDEAREDLKRRIAGIAEAIKDAVLNNNRGAPSIGGASKVDSCVNNIKRQLITPSNDWSAVIDTALNNCIRNKPQGQNLGIDSLLNVGCRKIIADTSGTATSQLKSGFDFVNNLIDAMVDRARRFCGGAHCQQQ